MCTICYDETVLFTLGEHACDTNHSYCLYCLIRLGNRLRCPLCNSYQYSNAPIKLAKPIIPIQPDYTSPYIKFMALYDLYQISNKSNCVVCQREHENYTTIVHFTNGQVAKCTVECLDTWTNCIHESLDESIVYVEYNIKNHHCYCGEQFFTSYQYFSHLAVEEMKNPIRVPVTQFIRQDHIYCVFCRDNKMIICIDNTIMGGCCFACYLEHVYDSDRGDGIYEWGHRIDINQYIEVECLKCNEQFERVGDYVSHTLICFKNRIGITQAVLYQLGVFCMNCYEVLTPVYVKSGHLIKCIDCARKSGMRGHMVAKQSTSDKEICAYLAKYSTHLYSDRIRSVVDICANCNKYAPEYRTAKDVRLCVKCVAKRKFSLVGFKYIGIAKNSCYICDKKMFPAYKKKTDKCGILFVCNNCAVGNTWEPVTVGVLTPI